MTYYKIGIDGGGTKTAAVLVDENNQIIDYSYSGPANIKNSLDISLLSITSVINELLTKYHLNKNDVKIGIGIAGFSVIEKRQQLEQNLLQLYSNVIITSDSHIACLAAHGNSDGAVIICGTGIVGYYTLDGIGTQLGGWGFPYGDLGGGAWIGLEICRLLCSSIDGSIKFSPILVEVFKRFNNDKNNYKNWLIDASPAKYADLAKTLPEYILQNDVNASMIFNKAILEIELLVRSLLQKSGNTAIKITGGLAKYYYPHLKNSFPNLELSISSSSLGATYIL
jgi:glucosamine kinase